MARRFKVEFVCTMTVVMEENDPEIGKNLLEHVIPTSELLGVFTDQEDYSQQSTGEIKVTSVVDDGPVNDDEVLFYDIMDEDIEEFMAGEEN